MWSKSGAGQQFRTALNGSQRRCAETRWLTEVAYDLLVWYSRYCEDGFRLTTGSVGVRGSNPLSSTSFSY
jgi:hypothetical protein